jgi:hypothetical protein
MTLPATKAEIASQLNITPSTSHASRTSWRKRV